MFSDDFEGHEKTQRAFGRVPPLAGREWREQVVDCHEERVAQDLVEPVQVTQAMEEEESSQAEVQG